MIMGSGQKFIKTTQRPSDRGSEEAEAWTSRVLIPRTFTCHYHSAQLEVVVVMVVEVVVVGGGEVTSSILAGAGPGLVGAVFCRTAWQVSKYYQTERSSPSGLGEENVRPV